ncbi:MAG: alpha/beta hydrolase [Candidatus Pacebacteria bacterium]|nr:alpha/beta hydrolase [Candidatus Paceibacterota bacterium]
MPERIIQVNGLNISLREEGQGTPFLILHGWGSGKDPWKEVQDILASSHRVIIFDFPGFRKSDAIPKPWNVDDFVNFFNSLLKEININEPFYLAGHSFGGRVVIKYSVRYPERIKEMFLIDSAGIKHKKTSMQFISYIFAKIFKKFSWIPGFNLFQKAFYKFIIRKTDYLYAIGNKKDTLVNVLKEDLTHLLEKITVKTHIIWGKDDKITPVKDAHIMHEKIKGSDLKMMPCGHMPYREKPRLLANTILEILKI